MKKYYEPLLCVQATPNEVIALNAAIGRHMRYFWREQEVNRLLAQFQRRLVENLPTVPLKMPAAAEGDQWQDGGGNATERVYREGRAYPRGA